MCLLRHGLVASAVAFESISVGPFYDVAHKSRLFHIVAKRRRSFLGIYIYILKIIKIQLVHLSFHKHFDCGPPPGLPVRHRYLIIVDQLSTILFNCSKLNSPNLTGDIWFKKYQFALSKSLHWGELSHGQFALLSGFTKIMVGLFEARLARVVAQAAVEWERPVQRGPI